MQKIVGFMSHFSVNSNGNMADGDFNERKVVGILVCFRGFILNSLNAYEIHKAL